MHYGVVRRTRVMQANACIAFVFTNYGNSYNHLVGKMYLHLVPSRVASCKIKKYNASSKMTKSSVNCYSTVYTVA